MTNAADGTVDRIDLATRTVRQTIRVGDGPEGIAFGAGSVWVANGLAGTVTRIDPRSNEKTQEIQVGVGPSGIAVGLGAVWVVNRDDSTLSKLDAVSGTVQNANAWKVGVGPVDVAVGPGSVWVTSAGTGEALRVNPRSGDVVDRVGVGRGPGAIAATSGAIWVVNTFDGTVSRIDPDASAVTATVQVGASPSGIAADDDAVWVASEQEGTISRIDPATNDVSEVVSIGGSPSAVATGPDGVFVGVRPATATHRGGTVTFVFPGARVFNGDDPALSFSLLLGLTNDGLTAFRRVGGADSAELVPDLAVSLPAPSDGGRSYTFRVQKGIRYSSGAPVRPSDFKVAFERLFQRGYGFDYEAIVGAGSCTPKQCDLSRGVEVDDGAGTVTFHLSEPDPYFLAKLAQAYAFAVPSGTRRRTLDSRPPPATGAYMIAGFVPGKQIRLVRNPRFREWSPAARPGSYADEIVIRLSASSVEGVNAVGRGDADVADLTNCLVCRVPHLRARYGARLHSLPGPLVVYAFLNTRVPPFDDIRVRKAVNYALDRDAIVRTAGGPDVASQSCQILPANSPGYRQYCPYERDLAEAKRLVAASGTRGMSVVFLTRVSYASAHSHVVRALRALGYRARLRVVDDRAYYDELFEAGDTVQAGYAGFAAAYPSAGSFIEGLLSSFGGQTGFADQAVAREITRARELQTTDPVGANEVWARVDRMIVDAAPFVPMYNLRSLVLVSERAGNFQFHPVWFTLLDQLWVR